MSRVDPLSIGRIMSADLTKLQRTEVASEEFETYLIEMMIKEMRKTVPKGMFSSSSMELFTELMDKAIAREIAESGGMGLASSMLQHMGEEKSTESIKFSQDAMPILRKIKDSDAYQEKMPQFNGELPISGRLTSEYGMRKHPILGVERKHDGIDIAAQTGTEIRNVMDGKVTFAGKRGGYGNTMIVEHENGLTSMYAHCNAISVSVGDVVSKGEVIGTVGSTGLSTGPHLHFEIQQDGEPIDPVKVFQWSFD